MKVTGIIAEYNPLHKGHEYQLKEARRLTGADYIVVVMSGCFTQRGTPAVLDKYDRARMALSCGADLVLELPVRFACASAEYFASGAVSVLNATGCVDTLCFGSECGDTQALLSAAAFLNRAEQSPEYHTRLRGAQKAGLSYPAARSRALEDFGGGDPSLFSLPNNILGIEYCRALETLKSPIRPLAIRRRGSYHDTRLQETASLPEGNGEDAPFISASIGDDASFGNDAPFSGDTPFSSASAIRAALRGMDAAEISSTGSSKDGQSEDGASACLRQRNNAFSPEEALRSSLPDISRQLLFERTDGRGVVTEEDFASLLRFRLLQLSGEGRTISGSSAVLLTDFADVTPSLADKIEKQLYSFTGWDDLCLRLRSRDLPYARASRSLCHILLSIRQEALDESKAAGFPVYLRMLGFSERALPLLSAIKKKAAAPLISRPAAAAGQLPPSLLPLFEEEIRASHIYQTVVSGKYGTPFLHEYQRQLICPSVSRL
ncbi:MAG TPA: nucleotidyltransferase family protein [Candidatus Eisenbergiella merdavium]|uniref:tRNA(Met) cytidine acetate ligase n=1 Tax=Candidatus Eisenbergiella merdavium TaxID=2838551 RepID=A0A9D2SPM3_9FIRM|nr:nucleotidyltransferase family protein [Candidatus Eisenbergiella merdavium]